MQIITNADQHVFPVAKRSLDLRSVAKRSLARGPFAFRSYLECCCPKFLMSLAQRKRILVIKLTQHRTTTLRVDTSRPHKFLDATTSIKNYPPHEEFGGTFSIFSPFAPGTTPVPVFYWLRPLHFRTFYAGVPALLNPDEL